MGTAAVAGATGQPGTNNTPWTYTLVATYDGYPEYLAQHTSISGNVTCSFYFAGVDGSGTYTGSDVFVSGDKC